MPRPSISINETNEERHRRVIATAVNDILRGKASEKLSFTLTANVASTTVTDTKFEYDMLALWIPTTANAAAELGNGTMYLSATSQGSFTVTHANNAQTDRIFNYVRFG